MNNIKTQFSIKDLENLSGVKAHTIRIWEKRHDLLTPDRTDTNIRTYNNKSLQKLLNIAYLNTNGIKISKIAKLPEEAILDKVKEIANSEETKHHAISSLKLAMMNFDASLFNTTYNKLLEKQSFTDIFYTVFLPLLNEIGILWQTKTIMPAHEHFISILIKQKILIQTDVLPSSKDSTKTFILFLPENEIHDIGLLFVNYLLKSKGHHTIYLGESVPLDNLSTVKTMFNSITFISYFTVKPDNKDLYNYLNDFIQLVICNTNTKLHILGHKTLQLQDEKLPKNISRFNSIKDLMESV